MNSQLLKIRSKYLYLVMVFAAFWLLFGLWIVEIQNITTLFAYVILFLFPSLYLLLTGIRTAIILDKLNKTLIYKSALSTHRISIPMINRIDLHRSAPPEYAKMHSLKRTLYIDDTFYQQGWISYGSPSKSVMFPYHIFDQNKLKLVLDFIRLNSSAEIKGL